MKKKVLFQAEFIQIQPVSSFIVSMCRVRKKTEREILQAKKFGDIH